MRHEPCDAVAETARIPERKSTRLNSRHANIPYAVFCLKKKISTSSPPSLSRFSLPFFLCVSSLIPSHPPFLISSYPPTPPTPPTPPPSSPPPSTYDPKC